MAQSLARAKDTLKPANAPEYSIYIYHHPANHLEGWNDWEKRTVTQDLQAALEEAESLYASQEFEKVEVKAKSFDSKKAKTVDKTLKIYKEDTLFVNKAALGAALTCIGLGVVLAVVKLVQGLL